MIWALALVSTSAISGDDLDNLAEAIYFEARSEPLMCQIIIAQTILNRVDQERYPNTIEEVVHQKNWSIRKQKYVCQYSYFCDGVSDTMSNYEAQVTSYQVASMVLFDDMLDFSEGADHYYAHHLVTPWWSAKLEDKFVCNNHTLGILNW